MLGVALIGVVGLSKAVSPALESAVREAGLPLTFVGVVIALLVLLPESIAAVKAAIRDEIQTSFNLALTGFIVLAVSPYRNVSTEFLLLIVRNDLRLHSSANAPLLTNSSSL